MPHQCTTCDRVFADGSKDMLSGCPDCGGNKFQFLPTSAVDSGDGSRESQPAGPVRESEPDADEQVGPVTRADPEGEDRAQASARRTVVSADELPRSAPAPPTEGDSDSSSPVEESAEATPADRPSLNELREQLNEQFESIKILRPGEYELNLMELYDREEYIIALEEDGRYVIDVPSAWRESDEEDRV